MVDLKRLLLATMLMLLLAAPAGATITYVGTTSAYSTFSTAAISRTPTVGNTLVVYTDSMMGNTPTSVTDNGGNIYTMRVAAYDPSNAFTMCLYTAPIVHAATTVTVAFTGDSGGAHAAAIEYSGVTGIGATTAAITSGTNPSGGGSLTLTLTSGGNVVVMTGEASSAPNDLSVTSGTLRFTPNPSAGESVILLDNTATTAVPVTITYTTTATWQFPNLMIQLLGGATASVGPTPRRLRVRRQHH